MRKEIEWRDAMNESPLELADCDLLRTDDVLCLMDDGTMTVCWYDIEDDLWVEAWGERAVAIASGKHVTHWAYLPDGPSA